MSSPFLDSNGSIGAGDAGYKLGVYLLTMRGRVLLTLALYCACSGQVIPPIITDVDGGVSPQRWMNGFLKVSWSAPSGYAVDSYEVTAAPLDYTQDFSYGGPVDSQDWVQDLGSAFDPATAGNSIAFTPLGLRLASQGNAQLPRFFTSLGSLPLAYRRIPESALGSTTSTTAFEVDADCSGVRPSQNEYGCGIVVFNQETGVPLLTWALRRLAAPSAGECVKI